MFTDINGDGTAVGLGDRVTVSLACEFVVATPLIGNILGGTIGVGAESDFPVKAGMTAVLPPTRVGTGDDGGIHRAPGRGVPRQQRACSRPTRCPVLSAIGPTVTVDFRDASGGGAPSLWAWNFGDGATATTQDAAHEYACTTPDSFGWCAVPGAVRREQPVRHVDGAT